MRRQYICSVLQKDIGARFKRIRKIPFLGNSPRCLILRRYYAKFMLKQLSDGLRIINIDQTWVNETNFTRCKWRLRGQVNSLAENKVSPRLAMQLAMCTSGKLYFSVTTANTDHHIFCLFMTKLAARLTKDDRNWRDFTLKLIDGAKY